MTLTKGGRCLRLGTRGSALARAQSALIARALEELHPGLKIKQVVIRTHGDRILDQPLEALGGKAVFVREIEQALLAREIDFAVHSLKDLPVELPEGLELAAVPGREDPADALVSPSGQPLTALAAGARVATGSPRRVAQLRLLRPDLECVPLRGNVDTRLCRLEEGAFEAMVLAVAGLRRLGRLDRRAHRLDPGEFVPAPGQGALAIETRRASDASDAVRALHHADSGIEVRAERALVKALGGSCQMPLGALGRVRGDRLSLNAFLSEVEGRRWVRDTEEGDTAEPEGVAQRLAARLLRTGGADILRALGLQPPQPGGPGTE